ncbi:MAG TPA: 4-hydroxythreonine-4-phosphate dehydrogenase PdxA [Elusimicrobia bacterium]|nr:4-hydroxythreonine-4-phosphate dehydrogenase PdxA [Elusimicrobiota bacterium]
MKPQILITAGDPLGVGPEITVKALRSAAVRRACRPFVAGDTAAMKRAGWTPALCPLLPVDAPRLDFTRPGPTRAGGRASLEAVLLAAGLVRAGFFSALVTAPVSKEAWKMAGAPAPAHTDLFRLIEKKEPLMLFSRGRINAALVTEHLPVKALSGKITLALVKQKAALFRAALEALGLRRPAITLCALNPHAGDGGVIGLEEIEVLRPAAAGLRAGGMRISGPLPTDAAWAEHLAGKSDGLLALYHDQALAPLKVAPGADSAVHWTWGLSFARTSPAHGTAFDRAWRAGADAAGMKAAILFAAHLAKNKRPARGPAARYFG